VSRWSEPSFSADGIFWNNVNDQCLVGALGLGDEPRGSKTACLVDLSSTFVIPTWKKPQYRESRAYFFWQHLMQMSYSFLHTLAE